MSDDSPNPYEAPQTELAGVREATSIARPNRNFKIWWIVVFCLNLPLCGFLGFMICNWGGRVGMLLAVVALLIVSTRAVAYAHPAILGGGVVVALLQFFPIIHLTLSIVAIWIVTLGDGDRDVTKSPLGLYEAAIISLLIGAGLLLAVVVFGTIFAVLFGTRDIVRTSRSYFSEDSK